jgi:hypothetical protein
MVYVLNKEGQPLMPTIRHRKVRLWLKAGQAKVIRRSPFTIQLLFDTTDHVQQVTLGLDAGYANIGFSAVTVKKELISGEVKLLKGMKERLKERSDCRKARRQRLRHREVRFNNRSRKVGWLAPSIQHKYDTHLKISNLVKRILPIAREIVETASFDIQKIKNPTISGKEYQEGETLDFYNLREYILHRDHHKCQNKDCKNKDEKKILVLHHIIYRTNGGSDAPSNLITLCTKCHTPKNHKGFLKTWKPEIKSFKPETFMSTVRWKLVNQLGCRHTFGYITKSKRIKLKLEKTHYNDAFVIAGGETQQRIHPLLVEQVRRNNRSLSTFYDAKHIDSRTGLKVPGKNLDSGRTKRNKNLNTENLRVYRQQKISKGRYSKREKRYPFQPKDLVSYKDSFYEVVGSQNKGSYVKLKDLKKVIRVNELTLKCSGKGFSIKNFV